MKENNGQTPGATVQCHPKNGRNTLTRTILWIKGHTIIIRHFVFKCKYYFQIIVSNTIQYLMGILLRMVYIAHINNTHDIPIRG